jgi:hypothetical protein
MLLTHCFVCASFLAYPGGAAWLVCCVLFCVGAERPRQAALDRRRQGGNKRAAADAKGRREYERYVTRRAAVAAHWDGRNWDGQKGDTRAGTAGRIAGVCLFRSVRVAHRQLPCLAFCQPPAASPSTRHAWRAGFDCLTAGRHPA